MFLQKNCFNFQVSKEIERMVHSAIHSAFSPSLRSVLCFNYTIYSHSLCLLFTIYCLSYVGMDMTFHPRGSRLDSHPYNCYTKRKSDKFIIKS